MPRPGEIYYLSTQHEEAAKGHRPHVAVSLVAEDSGVVTLAYCSTRATDAIHGAAHVFIDSASAQSIGLRRPTFVYPSRLGSYSSWTLGRPAGNLAFYLPFIRDALRRALGVSTGATRERNQAGSNRRGRIAKLTGSLAEDWDVELGLVVTEPTYSRHGFQQTIIPVFDADDFEARSLDVFSRPARWVRSAEVSFGSVILAIDLVSTVYQPEHIAHYTDAVVDEETMRRVDLALMRHFDL